jgi:hypothetical protein
MLMPVTFVFAIKVKLDETLQVFTRCVNKKVANSFQLVKITGVSGKYPTTGISIPDKELLMAARAKAKSQGRSLSNYIVRLLEKDLEDANMEWRERQNPNAEPSSKVDAARAKLLGGGAGEPVSYRRKASKKSATGKRPVPTSNEAP